MAVAMMWRSVLCIALPPRNNDPSCRRRILSMSRYSFSSSLKKRAAANGQYYHTFLSASPPISSHCLTQNHNINRKFGTTSVRLGQKTNDETDDEFILPPLPIAPEGAPPDSQVESDTVRWIQKAVIGLNLCPFADKPFRHKQLQVHVIRGKDDQMIAAEVLFRMMCHRKEAGTTVVVAPECYPNDFETYLSLVHYIEDELMTEHDLHGIIQLAPFHPKFTFEGSDASDVDNLTNRAPYPSFHILREEEVSLAVQKLRGDSSKVWNRNVRLLQNLLKAFGREQVERIIKGDDKVEGIEQVLKETKEEMEKNDDKKENQEK